MAITRSAGNIGWIGPVLYMIAYPFGTLILSRYLFYLGYRSGLEGVSRFMESGKLQLITDSLTILGLVVIGALAAAFVVVPFPIIIRSAGGAQNVLVNLETLLNNIFPRILPLLLTLFVYWLYGKKKWSPMAIMGLILVFAAIVTALGYLFRAY
jgi:PTS system mannose-specific IID component